ncbi:MAG: carbon-nitrogen hydrolase family protein [Methanothrix sp.]|nr:carbon-nitrogen hydrolase family protein [Methanothrix sp.]
MDVDLLPTGSNVADLAEDTGLPDGTLRVALVHAEIAWKDRDRNISSLLALNEEAAGSGSKIILNTELATTGYAFESRKEIAPLTETIPGPTTEAFGIVAREYGCYICIGLAERDARTGLFYNSAVLLDPTGRVSARYRKASPAFRENLWAAKGNLPVPVAKTRFGPLGIVICADSYSYRQARIAALKGAVLLLIPANWPPQHHNPDKFWRARALENGMYVLACNRAGRDRAIDCSLAESFIIDPQGRTISKTSSRKDTIIYGNLPLRKGLICQGSWGSPDVLGSGGTNHDLLRGRRPGCYCNIALDPYSYINIELLLGLPQAADFNVATLQFSPRPQDPDANMDRILQLIDDAVSQSIERERAIDLAVLPELSTSGPIFSLEEALVCAEEVPGRTTDILSWRAGRWRLFLVLGMAERDGEKLYNSSVIIGPEGVVGRYRKVHLSEMDRGWASPGNEGFSTHDLPFARIGMLIGHDLVFPEAADSLAKLGADMLCVPALWHDAETKFIWEARLAEQMHLAVANQWGGRIQAVGGSLLCNYSRHPERISHLWSPLRGDAIRAMRFRAGDAREKRFLENVDYDLLLQPEVADPH